MSNVRFLMPVFRAVLLALMFSVISGGGFHASAQTPPSAQSAQETHSALEKPRAEISQIEAALTREQLDEKRLTELRARLDPVFEQINALISREQPRLDDIKARIEKLGPSPDAAKGQSESEDVAQARKEQQSQLTTADDALRIARALALRGEQLRDAIAEKRRQNFSRAILTPTSSIASPLLWLAAVKALPGEFRAFRTLIEQWSEIFASNVTLLEVAALLGLIALAAVGWPFVKRWVSTGTFRGERDPKEIEEHPTRLTRALMALRQVVTNAVVPALVFFLLHWLFENFGLLPARAVPVMAAMTGGAAFIVGMSGLASGLLAPDRAAVRLFPLPDTMAREIWRLMRRIVVLVVIGRVLEAIQTAIVSSLPITMVTKGVISVLVTLVLARGLQRIFRAPETENTLVTNAQAALLPLRLLGWALVLAIFGAALTGYVSLAGFLVNQVIWLSILGLVLLLMLVLIDEFLGQGMSSSGAFGRRVRDVTGLAAGSLDQVAVLGSGFARLVLYLALVMLALAPWGIDSGNLVGNLKTAFFGFQVGGVTISLSTIGLAIVFFAAGLFITRSIQNWLDTRYLPHTGLDVGLRNSIRTIFGYIGTIAAAMVALTQVGLSMEKLTLVAGALSVGIGFGLKSIVENFVSGLILLWERPIRVGDLIIVGTEQGKVKRINVRATEIETFDRASLIIPNAEFIAGRVKNWTHADRMARIIIPVTVDSTSDPAEVKVLLKDAALAHREVMTEPPPVVIFKELGENGFDFELRCFTDVDSTLSTRSEVLFEIVERLRKAKIDVPFPTRRLEITNLASMVDQGAFMPKPPKKDEFP